jgi:D-aminoacyl-tRNA deacylase
MRAVVQRVRWARVTVDGEVVGEIGPGLLVYVGVGDDDGEAEADWLSKKVAGLRVFPDDRRPMNRSLAEVGGEVLVVSQFTLYGDCRKGRRPSFNEAMEPTGARELVERFRRGVEDAGFATEAGLFGASMDVESSNHGPVTLILETEKSL